MTARNNLANGNGTLSCLSSPSFPTDMRWSARERGAEAGGGVSRGRRTGRSEIACPMLDVKQSEITKAFQFLCLFLL